MCLHNYVALKDGSYIATCFCLTLSTHTDFNSMHINLSMVQLNFNFNNNSCVHIASYIFSLNTSLIYVH